MAQNKKIFIFVNKSTLVLRWFIFLVCLNKDKLLLIIKYENTFILYLLFYSLHFIYNIKPDKISCRRPPLIDSLTPISFFIRPEFVDTLTFNYFW